MLFSSVYNLSFIITWFNICKVICFYILHSTFIHLFINDSGLEFFLYLFCVCASVCVWFVKIELLSCDSRLALNVLLAKHKFVPEQLATWLSQGDIDSIGADTLKLLLTLLPLDEEVHIFKLVCFLFHFLYSSMFCLVPSNRLQIFFWYHIVGALCESVSRVTCQSHACLASCSQHCRHWQLPTADWRTKAAVWFQEQIWTTEGRLGC